MSQYNELTLEEEIELVTKIMNDIFRLASWYNIDDRQNMNKVIVSARLLQEIMDSRLGQKCPSLRNGLT